MRHAYTSSICLLLSFAVTAIAAEPSVGANGWRNIAGVLEGTITTRPVDTTRPSPPLGYLEYLPLGYDPADMSASWPLVVFISGDGELGDGTDTDANSHQLYVNMVRHGPFRQMTTAHWDFPAIVIAVQQPGYWNNATILAPVFEYLKAKYRVDTKRMHLTGLCDGAVGVFNFASQHPGYLASILVIEGGSDPNPGMAAMLVDQPMWAVHCFNDTDIARTSTVLWVDQATLAVDPAAAGVMSTYPAYPGNPNHMAVDTDPVTGRPLDPFGPTMVIPASSVTAGSREVVFGSTIFGSAMFNTWNGSDAWPYALVHAGNPPDRSAKAGVMFRDSLAPGATHVMVAQGPNNEVFLNWRSATDGASGSGVRSGGRAGVKWVRLTRSGSVFTGSYSLDGVEWISLGSRTVAISGNSCLGGLAVTAHNDSTTYTKSFTGLSLGEGLVGVDIGSPGRAGSATFADGVWTVVGSGRDIWNAADQFHYAYTEVTGDETITARIGTDTTPQVIALGKPDRLFLTRPYAGPTTVQDLYIQLPVGYNNTAYYDAATHAWIWQRNQNWDRTRSGKHIFTMAWYKNHVQGWIDTYSNGGCWDWLFSQSLPSAPMIISHPQNIAVTEGDPATFSVDATGTDPLSWQWLRDGSPVAGATAASLTINPTTFADHAARVSVTLTNSVGTVTSQVAVLTIRPFPPMIITQPQSQSVPDGQVATFSAVANGAGPMTWQWYRDGAAMAGATASSHTTAANTMAESGSRYSVTAGNAGGSVASATAVLSVTAAAPVITTQPVSTTVPIGQSASFAVAASGTPVLQLQWQRSAPAGGAWTDISGAASPTYRTVTMVASEEGARYRCRVRNSVGEAMSEPATLAVGPAPPSESSDSGDGGSGGSGGCGVGTALAFIIASLTLFGLRVRGDLKGCNSLGFHSLLILLGAALAAAEPTVASNGWSNIPGIVEGTVITRPVDTTFPRPPLGFVEYLPKGYAPADASVSWPLVVMCTGIGERGDGTDTVANGHQLYTKMVKHGPLHQVVRKQWDFPGIIIVPQQPTYWKDASVLKQVFEWAKANRRVDPDRLYLTGLCDGASGLLSFASSNPGYLAGILPIETSSAPKDGMAAAIRDLPMWAVHCFNDPSIARTSSIAWVDQVAWADFGASNVMLTYPGFAGKPYHVAVDCDPQSGLPLDPFGPVTYIPLGTLTAGSTWVGFGATSFGSATFNSWGGTEVLPYAQVRRGWAPVPGVSPTEPPLGVVSVGKPTCLYLTKPYAGASEVSRLYIQIPVGYNATAVADRAGAWTWRRGQAWDRALPGRRLFTMCWYQDHVQGWVDTYANGDCWDWLYSQTLQPVEPALAVNGWSNREAVVEGSIMVRPVDTTLPRPPYGHVVYLPNGYDGIAAWPLVIHLGAIAEAGDGTDNASNGHQLYNNMVKSGPLRQVLSRQWDFPAIIIAPQVSTNWAKPLNVKNLLTYAQATFQVDPDRIYLTGALEGANGALRFAVAYPGDPAALLTVEAGIPASSAQAAMIRSLPLWAAHAFADPLVARGHSIAWIEALATASSTVTSDAMATHPGYGRDRGHFAVDIVPQTGRPLDPLGESTTIAAATLVPGSTLITFPGVSFGSSVFGMWGGSEALPFAQVVLPGEGVAYTVARGYPSSLTLTAPYAGTATTASIAIRTPVGYDVTAFREPAGPWNWHRGQPWTPAQPDQQVLSLFWRQSAADAWTRTWNAVEVWNWLFSQLRAPAGSS